MIRSAYLYRGGGVGGTAKLDHGGEGRPIIMASVGLSGGRRSVSGIQSHKTEGRVIHRSLSEVIVGDGESFEAALRRFNKKIQQAGILAEARRREFYERPAARRKRKEAKRRKR